MWNERPEHGIYKNHPNPAWARRDWTPLDGVWNIKRGGREAAINVPFPVGSAASGIDFPDSGTFLYSRSLDIPRKDGESRYCLNIGAADYEARVIVNGRDVGRHSGGYASFRIDITEALREGPNDLAIEVRDSHAAWKVRGKQTFLRNPFVVWYSGYAGIWQPVWLERTGSAFIASARVREDPGLGEARGILVSANVEGLGGVSADARLLIEIEAPDGTIAAREAAVPAGGAAEMRLPFTDIGEFPWSAEKPDLYRIAYRLVSGGRTLDAVDSYFGLRRVEARDGKLFLNGKELFLKMALVQGYYPRGGYTPEGPEAIVADIEALKRMGFNGARIHQKIESPRFHYLCDAMGLLVTYEMPSFYRPTRRGFDAFERELREIIARDAMHPSSIAWVIFNETWGVWGIYGRRTATRRFAERMIKMTRELDPERLVIDNSGWEHFDTDIVDCHHYLSTAELANAYYAKLKARDPAIMHGLSKLDVLRFYINNAIAKVTRAMFIDEESERTAAAKKAPWLLSEYGGFGWYTVTEKGSVEDKIERYTNDAVKSGLFCGYCLTQLYDVGSETNGLLTADRAMKVDGERIAAINSRQGALKP
jgi:beta-galactosidase/beta-glucuronidase